MTGDRLSVLAHELRSPVAALAALAERAGTSRLDDATFGRLVALALVAGRDVERLLLDPDLLSMRPVPVDLGEVLRAVVPPGVSVSVQPATVVGDPTRLRQAVSNLVDNALRHGAEATVEGGPVGNSAVIYVRDDGPGVDPAIDPFAKGVGTAGSSGYGLWLERAIVEAHGGRLELEPSRGTGAVFRLSLPLASAGSG